MPPNDMRHYFRPLGKTMLERSQPDMSDKEERRIREADADFVRALAKAFQRGDHLPAGEAPFLRLIG